MVALLTMGEIRHYNWTLYTFVFFVIVFVKNPIKSYKHKKTPKQSL